MTYDIIRERFYILMDDPDFYKQDELEANDLMNLWMSRAASDPRIRSLFNVLTLQNDTEELNYELTNPVDSNFDDNFVIDIFAQYMAISWMKPKIDSMKNLAVAFGGKEEKKLQSNYNQNKERLKELKNSLNKEIRDYGYMNNDYIKGDS